MPPIFQEAATFAAGGQSAPIDIANIHALRGIQLDFTGALTVGVAAATLTSAGGLGAVRTIELTVAGETHMRIGLEDLVPGGQLLEALNRAWFGALPAVADPAVAVGANAFSWTLVIPFAGSEVLHKNLTPDERDMMCFRRNGRKCQLQVQWGADTAVAAPGGGGTAVVSGTLRVSMLEDRKLDNVAAGDAEGRDPLNHYLRLVSEAIPASASVQPAEQQRLNLGRGQSPGILLYALDNDAASDAWLNSVQILLNGNDQRFNASYAEMRDLVRKIAGSTIAFPTGMVMAWFDDTRDGLGMLPLGSANVGSTIIQTDHDVSAGGNLRFSALHMYLP